MFNSLQEYLKTIFVIVSIVNQFKHKVFLKLIFEKQEIKNYKEFIINFIYRREC